ncbi:MAG: hypothetical protein HRT71_21210, partial [Flavobacteriales bacterium]|nr:hypothetical protein [Flavobacteriales bacterium]
GLVKGVEVEADKYYLIFFAVSNATYSGNQYRVTRVVGTEPTGSGYELEKTYYLHYSSPHQRSIAPYLDIELTFSADNQWTGDTDTDWAGVDNWSRDIVPSDFASVTIAASDNDPTISTTISIGELEVQSGASLDVTGEVSVTGDLTNSGEIAGDVVLNGSSAQSVNLGTIEEVEVDNSSGVTLTGDASISRVITLTDGDIEIGGYALELLSDEDYTGLIVDDGGTITGDVTVNRHVPAGFGQHFISLPTSDGDVDQLEDNFNTYLSAPSPRLHEYDEVSSTWIVPSSLADLMPTGQGFAATFGTVGSAITIDVTGTANTGNIPVSLTHSSTGWNLIGNPYPSPIDWDRVSKPDSMSEAFYVWDYAGGRDGHYMSYIDGVGTNDGTNLIPCMQGFFVYTGDNTTLTFENDDRESDPDNTLVPFKSKSNNPLIRLSLEGEGYQSETVVRFKEAATANYDAKYDAILLESGIPASIDFGTVSSDSRKLVINTLAYEDQYEQIPIYSRIGTKGDYTIDMTETSGALETPILLKDLVLDSIHVLNDVSYAFSATANNSNNRFVLIPRTTVEIEENETAGRSVTAFKNGNQVYINLGSELKENTAIDIYSISGQRIYQDMISKGTTYYNFDIGLRLTNTVLIIKIGGINDAIKIY